MTADDGFDREAYLSLADEFDPMGAVHPELEPILADFEPTYVEAARRFAAARGIPVPWSVRSMDNAIAYVRSTDVRSDV